MKVLPLSVCFGYPKIQCASFQERLAKKCLLFVKYKPLPAHPKFGYSPQVLFGHSHVTSAPKSLVNLTALRNVISLSAREFYLNPTRIGNKLHWASAAPLKRLNNCRSWSVTGAASDDPGGLVHGMIGLADLLILRWAHSGFYYISNLLSGKFKIGKPWKCLYQNII